MNDIKAHEAVLRTRLAELSGCLHRIGYDLEQPPNLDWADKVLEGLGQTGTIEIGLIHTGIARIKCRTYGLYVRCRDDISDEQLNVIRHTALGGTYAANATKTN